MGIYVRECYCWRDKVVSKTKTNKKKIIFLNNVKDPNTGTRCHKMNSWEAQQHYEAGEWPVAFFISLGAFRMA